MADTTRIHAREHELVPRLLIRTMLALILTVLALVTVARITDRPLESTPPETPVVSERAIYLDSDASGSARVLDATGNVLVNLPPDKGGFVAGIDRVIARERSRAGASLTEPVILRLRSGAEGGNRLSIYDPETGWNAELMGFGADNLRTFARLLEAPKGGS